MSMLAVIDLKVYRENLLSQKGLDLDHRRYRLGITYEPSFCRLQRKVVT